MAERAGTADMRKSLFEGIVKGFALASYKFKQAISISPTGAWKNFFWREDPNALTAQEVTAGTLNPIKGIPRFADFPQASVEFQRVQANILKYGLEDTIAWEDIISDDVDVRDRTLLRIAEGVIKQVDDEIWDVLTEGQVPATIQTILIADTKFWDGSSAAIMDDLAHAKQLIGEKNYPTDNLMCYISEKDHRSILNYVYEKGAQAPALGNQAAKNGNIGSFGPIKTFIVSNSVTASFALVVVPKRVGTWKALVPLQTVTEERPLKSVTITSAEWGVTQLTDPEAAVLIRNTQRD